LINTTTRLRVYAEETKGVLSDKCGGDQNQGRRKSVIISPQTFRKVSEPKNLQWRREVILMIRRISAVIIILMFGFTADLCAKTIQEFGKWKVGENLIENSGFEDNTDAWTLEAGAGGDRNCVISWVIEKQNPHLGKRCLHIKCDKVSGVNWHAKVRQDSSSMKSGKTFTIAFYARAGKPRTVSISVQMQHDPWTFYEGGDIPLESGEWKQYSHPLTATFVLNSILK